MQVRKLDTSRRRDVCQFINFPFVLYRDCPQWVPPFVDEMKLALNRDKHPFYRHSEADFYVVESERETLGRIAVLNNRNFNAFRHSRTGFFYYFDAINDVQVSRALFGAAFEWACARGLDKLIGPKGLAHADAVGILIEGFEHRPAMGVPYNYPYYQALVEDAGFEKETDSLSAYIGPEYKLSPRVYELAARVAERRGLSIKTFRDEKELRAWAGRIGDVFNASFSEFEDFWPLTEEEIKLNTERLLAIADPRLIKLVMKGDEVIGFIFAFPDISAAIQRVRGRLWPFGWLDLKREFKRTKWVNLNGAGILAGHRGVGADTLLAVELEKTVRGFGFEHADIVQVGETNLKSKGEIEAFGAKFYKRHRIYRRVLP